VCLTATVSIKTSGHWPLSVRKLKRLAKDRDDELAILERNIYNRLEEVLVGKQAASGPKGVDADAKITSRHVGRIAEQPVVANRA
jgi:hypothetical protein